MRLKASFLKDAFGKAAFASLIFCHDVLHGVEDPELKIFVYVLFLVLETNWREIKVAIHHCMFFLLLLLLMFFHSGQSIQKGLDISPFLPNPILAAFTSLLRKLVASIFFLKQIGELIEGGGRGLGGCPRVIGKMF